jgi:hypothetical protein
LTMTLRTYPPWIQEVWRRWIRKIFHGYGRRVRASRAAGNSRLDLGGTDDLNRSLSQCLAQPIRVGCPAQGRSRKIALRYGLAARLSFSRPTKRTYSHKRRAIKWTRTMEQCPPLSGMLSAALFFSNFQVGGIGQ